MIKDFLNKLSSYNAFSYLLFGALFTFLAKRIVNIDVSQENIFVEAFICYFIGLLISSVGSAIIEPIFERMNRKSAELVDPKVFREVKSKDPILNLLFEFKDIYRMLTSTFVLLGLVKLYYLVSVKWEFLPGVSSWSLIILLIALFLFSYIKQEKCITKRVKAEQAELECVKLAEHAESERVKAERVKLVEQVKAEQVKSEYAASKCAKLECAEAERAEAERVKLEHAELDNITANYIALAGKSKLVQTELERVKLEYAKLERVKLEYAKILDCANLKQEG